MANPRGTPENLRPKPFLPGNRANPGGRPKGMVYPTEHLRSWANMTAEELDRVPAAKRTTTWAVAKAILDNAIAGEYQQIREYLERLEGKVKDRAEIDVNVRTWAEIAREAE